MRTCVHAGWLFSALLYYCLYNILNKFEYLGFYFLLQVLFFFLPFFFVLLLETFDLFIFLFRRTIFLLCFGPFLVFKAHPFFPTLSLARHPYPFGYVVGAFFLRVWTCPATVASGGIKLTFLNTVLLAEKGGHNSVPYEEGYDC